MRLGVRVIAGIAAAALVAAAVTADEPAPTSQPADDKEARWQPPVPPASKQRVAERRQMVHRQIAQPNDGRARVTAKEVHEAMRIAPRHVFVPESERQLAYIDYPLRIGHGQTISQPYVVALMTEVLELDEKKKVLEIGTGSGYQAAVLAQLTPHVYTVEIIAPLAKRAAKALAEQGYKNVKTRCGDGYFGWEEHSPYDAIIVTCAAGHLPPPLWQQLKPGGKMVISIGGPYETQRLVVITKTKAGKRESRTIIPVRFVPLTRGKQSSR